MYNCRLQWLGTFLFILQLSSQILYSVTSDVNVNADNTLYSLKVMAEKNKNKKYLFIYKTNYI